jgi:chromosome partitioning protein
LNLQEEPVEKRRVAAIWNEKGGSGKTSTAVCLAEALAERGERVLVIDLDPQAQATLWLGCESDGRGVLAALTEGADLSPAPTVIEGVDLVGSGRAMLAAERQMVATPVGADLLLRRSLSRLGPSWSVVLLDCPPAFGKATSAALVAASELLVPVEASTLPLAALGAVMGKVRLVEESYNAGLTSRTRAFVCRYDPRTSVCRAVLAQVQEALPGQTFETFVRESTRMREAPSHRLPIGRYEERGRAAEDYRNLAREFVEVIDGR